MSDKIIITHNAGFFSCCNIRLKHIVEYFNKFKELPKIVDSSKQFVSFKNDQKIDISELLFKNSVEDIEYINDIKVIDSELEDQFSIYKLINFKNVNKFINKYFSPSDLIVNRINFFTEKYNINLDNTISVFYRGNDKVSETKLGSYETFLTKMLEIKIKNPEMKFLIQTDEQNFIDYCRPHIDFIVIDELPRIYKNNNKVIHNLVTDKESFVIDFFSITNILSKSKVLITHSGNCGLWATYLRGNCENVHQYLNPKNNTLKENWY